MQGIPETVDLRQIQAAARNLGLPLTDLTAFSWDVRTGGTATIYVRDGDGNRIRHGDDYVRTTLRLSVVPEGVPDAAARQ